MPDTGTPRARQRKRSDYYKWAVGVAVPIIVAVIGVIKLNSGGGVSVIEQEIQHFGPPESPARASAEPLGIYFTVARGLGAAISFIKEAYGKTGLHKTIHGRRRGCLDCCIGRQGLGRQ